MVALLVVAACSVLIPVMIALCAAGRIPRNSIVGLRLPALFVSDRAWESGHRAAILPSVVTAVIVVGIAIGATTIAGPLEIVTGVALGIFVIGIVLSAVIGNRAARSAEADAR